MARNIRIYFLMGVVMFGVVVSLPPLAAEAAVVHRPPNNLNLKAYWSFNEGSGTVATDFSRNYATGTLTNFASPATATSGWGNGKQGKGLAFDGTDDYIQTSFKPTGYSAITISAWVNLSSASSYPMIVSHGANGDSVLELRGSASTGKIECVNRSNNTGVVDSVSAVGTGWHHYVCVGTGTNFTLYKNGVSLGSAGISHGLTSTVNLRIGRRSDDVGGSFYFPGKIDEVRIYSSALTANEVMSLYRSGTVTLSALQRNPVTSSLLAHWTFDGRDVSDGVFLDTGNGTHPAYLGSGMATATAYAPGRVGQGLKFDGVDDYARVPNSADFDFGSNNFTIAWWEYRTSNDNGLASISRSSTGTTYVPFMVGYSNAGADLLVYMSSDLASWDIASGEVLGPVTLNQWAHYAVKRSGTTFTTYKNGTQISTWESASALAAAGGTDPQYDLTLGGYYLDTYFFRGTLDDVRIYNRAITSTELSQIYAAGVGATAKVNLPKNTFMANGLVGLWSFDGQDMVAGTTAYDRSGSGYDGTLVSIAATDVRPGKVGQALYFDGTNSEITIPNLDAYGTRSVSFWMKRGRDPAAWFDGIIGCSSTGGWGIGIYDYNGVGSKIYDGKIGVTDYRSTAGITDQEWHHIVETRGGGTIKFYIDGVLDSSQADSDTYSCGGGAATYQIGNINSTSPKFQGLIDDLRLYNRVLTAEEVSALYNRTK